MTKQTGRFDGVHNFDNTGVCVKQFADKGRGLAALQEFAVGDVILSSPVKILDPLEFQILRLMPAIKGFLKTNVASGKNMALSRLFHGLKTMLDDPDSVLSGDHAEMSKDSAIMYTFGWDLNNQDEEMTTAIVFGIASLCNHSDNSNEVNARAVQNTPDEVLDLLATKPIKSGEEILLHYRSTPFE